MLNEVAFIVLAGLTLLSAVAALCMRNLVHCALCVAGAFAGLAAVYLQLDAEFVGFAQILVYVGAVAILILFAVLLTRGAEVKIGTAVFSRSWMTGLGVAALVLASIVMPILSSPSLKQTAPPIASAPVKAIGQELMTRYVLPLETIGLLLTAALIGAVVVALREKKPATPKQTFELSRRGNIESVGPTSRFDFPIGKE